MADEPSRPPDMAFRPLTLTTPDRTTLTQILASRNLAEGDTRTLAELVIGLSESVVVPSSEVPPTVVTLNSRVRIRPVGSEAAREVTLVLPGQADLRQGQVSVLTPVGSALLGRYEGDVVACDAPAGRVRFRIEAVLYQPEAAEGLPALAA